MHSLKIGGSCGAHYRIIKDKAKMNKIINNIIRYNVIIANNYDETWEEILKFHFPLEFNNSFKIEKYWNNEYYCSDINKSEIRDVVKYLKNKKATGSNEMPAEIMNNTNDNFMDKLGN